MNFSRLISVLVFVLPIRVLASAGDANWDSVFSANGFPTNVNAIAVSGNNVYVGGDFITAGNVTVNRIAKWNGSNWLALGNGVNDTVNAIAVNGTDVYVAGCFTNASGVSANRIAKWNGNTWSALGGGLNGACAYAVAVTNNDVYVGGDFTTAGGGSARRIAHWNSSSWSALGPGLTNGLNGDVYAVAISGTNVYAGGIFDRAGGVAMSNIACWNGTRWSALGSGVDIEVDALAASGTSLYVGGFFGSAGPVNTDNIARWNGASWFAMASGANDAVYAVSTSGTNVYAGGDFTSPGNQIAQWDGSSWSTLGSGVNTSVYTVAVLGNDVYAGGIFTNAGGKASPCIGRFIGLPAVTITRTADASEFGQVGGVFLASRFGGSNIALNVLFKIEGSASNGLDYATLTNSVTIASNRFSAFLIVFPIPDNIAEGDRTITLTVSNRTTYTIGNPSSATILLHDKPFDAWRFAHFTASELANAAISGDTADPDVDGIVNLLEYAFNLDPKIASGAGLPTQSLDQNHLALTFRVNKSAIDLTYIVQVSSDLVTWNSGPSYTSAPVVLADDGSTQTVKVSDLTLVTGANRRFMRLRIVRAL